jgi:hypothetical protein
MDQPDGQHVTVAIHGEADRGDTLLVMRARGLGIPLGLLKPLDQRAAPARNRAGRRWRRRCGASRGNRRRGIPVRLRFPHCLLPRHRPERRRMSHRMLSRPHDGTGWRRRRWRRFRQIRNRRLRRRNRRRRRCRHEGRRFRPRNGCGRRRWRRRRRFRRRAGRWGRGCGSEVQHDRVGRRTRWLLVWLEAMAQQEQRQTRVDAHNQPEANHPAQGHSGAPVGAGLGRRAHWPDWLASRPTSAIFR